RGPLRGRGDRVRAVLAASEGVALLDEVVAPPLVVGANHLLGVVLRLRGGASLGLTFDEVGMGGEILDAMSAEVFESLELVLLHKCEQLLAERLDETVAMLHHAGADLHRVGAEEDELRGVLARLNPADPADRATGELFANDLGDFHDHPQGDRQYGTARVTAGSSVT